LAGWQLGWGSTASVVADDMNVSPKAADVLPELTMLSFNIHDATEHASDLAELCRFPVNGLDHVLGNLRVRLEDYQIIDAGFSDHCAQLTRFTVRCRSSNSK
jgi:hypothetical protein